MMHIEKIADQYSFSWYLFMTIGNRLTISKYSEKLLTIAKNYIYINHMKKTSTLLLLIIFSASLISCFPSKKSRQMVTPDIRNIVFMIGDGMGLP